MVLPLVADAAVPPAGGQLAARAIRRHRRTTRDPASGEPVSSSGDATEREKEYDFFGVLFRIRTEVVVVLYVGVELVSSVSEISLLY